MQSVPITTNVTSSNLVQAIQHYVPLVAGTWFSLCTPFSSTNKTYRHDITEILLKVALNTINLHQSKTIEDIRLCYKTTDAFNWDQEYMMLKDRDLEPLVLLPLQYIRSVKQVM